MNQTGKLLPSISSEHLQRLLMASKALSSSLDVREIIDLVIDVAADLTDSQAASLLLSEPDSDNLRFVATSDPESSPILGIPIPREDSVAGWVVSNNEPFISHHLQPDEGQNHYREIILKTGWIAKSMLAVPLRHKGEMLGVLEAVNKFGDAEYTDHDVAVVQALASQAAMAIANARLFQQSDAIAEVMHELKTPLMALTAGLELMERNDLPEEQRQQIIGSMHSETRRMSKMTQDFLELSRLDSGRIQLSRDQVNLMEIIQAVVESQKPAAEQANLTIGIFIPPDPPLPLIVGDTNRLKQVLLNLVSNAIKYNRPGGRVAIRARRENGVVRISVADTGRGIAPEDLEHLFKRFYRVPNSEGYAEGSGLGLSIAQKIVEAHGGHISVESESGKGTIFHCVLPIGGGMKEYH